jgi:hypothetical protein
MRPTLFQDFSDRLLINNPLYLILLVLQLIKLLPLKERFRYKESIKPREFVDQ